MKLKLIAACVLVLSALILVIGCGGGGGGGTSSTASAGSTATAGSTAGSSGLTSLQVTAVFQSNSSQMIDLRSVLVGDQLQLEVTARNTAGVLVVVPSTNWSTTAPSGIATITSDGALSANGSSGSQTYLVSTKASGKTYTATLAVGVAQDIVTGVLVNKSGVAVLGAAIYLYDASGTKVATAYSARDGSFRASTPGTATRFTIDTTPGDVGNVQYYLSYGYGTLEYLDGTSCLAPLGITPSSSAATPLPNPIVPDLKVSGPPPPPTGCL